MKIPISLLFLLASTAAFSFQVHPIVPKLAAATGRSTTKLFSAPPAIEETITADEKVVKSLSRDRYIATNRELNEHLYLLWMAAELYISSCLYAFTISHPLAISLFI